MSPLEAGRKDVLARSVLDALATLREPDVAPADLFWVPGRIEFLGKHTDYAGGRSLVCAAERGICLAAAPRSDDLLRMRDATSGESLEVAMTGDIAARPGDWSDYARTVVRRIQRNFPGARIGADVVFASDLPRAAGMSSSSALVVATFLALDAVNGLAERAEYRAAIHDDAELAGYLGTVENGLGFGALTGEHGVGTFGGSEDHTAILCAVPGALVQFSYCPVRFERTVPLPPAYVFVIASSGVVAEKTGAALDRYNRLSQLATEALAWLRAADRENYPTLSAALATHPDLRSRPEWKAPINDAMLALLARVEQFTLESDVIVPEAGDALIAGDLERLGALVDRSQAAAEQLLGNQVPETEFLAHAARARGAVAASAFGAGFGGSVWALVREDAADAFRRGWAAEYAARFPARALRSDFFITRAGPHALRLPST